MKASQHAKVWRDAERRLEKAAHMFAKDEEDHQRYGVLSVFAACVAKGYEIAANEEEI